MKARTLVRASVMVAAMAACVRMIGCTKDGGAVVADPNPAHVPTATQPVKSVAVVQPAIGMQQRMGDEIVVAGHLYRIGTRVVTWMDPGGYDAYRTERRFAPWQEASYEATTQAMAELKAAKKNGPDITSPNRYGVRYAETSAGNAATQAATRPASYWASPTTRPLTPQQFEMIRGGGWPLELLQQKVDQFVIHYDVAGTSRQCFAVLQDDRDLSVQFMLDLDGTIYQTCDLKERAWQATKANSRSVGIEIANMGSYGSGEPYPLDNWYKKDAQGKTYITIPQRLGGLNSQYTHPSILRPARNDLVIGQIRGVRQRQYDFTPQQYEALSKLIAGLCDVFPLMKCDYPRDPQGKPLMRTLTDQEYNVYQGVLGHYHVQDNKSDPGPAFQWEKVVGDAKKMLDERRSQRGG